MAEKQEPPQGEFAQFLYQERDGFAFCALCISEQGQNVKPLPYPAVKICISPPQARETMIGGKKALHWHWEFTNFCIAHAFVVLAAMQPHDIMPHLKDTHPQE